MYRIIANPAPFDNGHVVFWGYLAVGELNGVVWPNRTAFEHGPSLDGVYISFDPKQLEQARKLDGKWIMIEGIFEAKKQDEEPEFAGAIKPVLSFRGWE